MSDKAKNGKRVCVWIYYLMCAALLTAKTCGWVGWSWWWVTAPLWIPFGLIVLVLAVCYIGLFFENDAIEGF